MMFTTNTKTRLSSRVFQQSPFVFGAVGLNMALTNDLVRNPAFSASAAGILLFGGNSFGSMAPLVTGFIVKRTGSFDAAFVLAGVLMIMAALISYFMTRVPIEAPSTDDKVVQAAAG
jgi:ACS family glucarate transporter-like MFS transporter